MYFEEITEYIYRFTWHLHINSNYEFEILIEFSGILCSKLLIHLF